MPLWFFHAPQYAIKSLLSKLSLMYSRYPYKYKTVALYYAKHLLFQVLAYK